MMKRKFADNEKDDLDPNNKSEIENGSNVKIISLSLNLNKAKTDLQLSSKNKSFNYSQRSNKSHQQVQII